MRDIAATNPACRFRSCGLRGYDYSIDADAVIHVRNRHGDDAKESLQGQRAVTAQDYARLPLIIEAPDDVQRAPFGDDGEPRASCVKRIGDELYIATFEVRAKRTTIALVSMYVRRLRPAT